MTQTLPDLPYAIDALAPLISAETLEYHHGKHHATYVTKLNGLIEGTSLADWPLDELVVKANEAPAEIRKPLFNNAAQHLNHSFYWQCLRPVGGDGPTGSLAAPIDGAFGDFDAFKESFTNESVNHFGSGWGWLVKKADGSIGVTSTHDAGNPLTDGETPLLTCDVWEHAYYIDYRNARPKYLASYWDLVNWEFVAANFEA